MALTTFSMGWINFESCDHLGKFLKIYTIIGFFTIGIFIFLHYLIHNKSNLYTGIKDR